MMDRLFAKDSDVTGEAEPDIHDTMQDCKGRAARALNASVRLSWHAPRGFTLVHD